MANHLYARLQQTAHRLIDKYGQKGAVLRMGPPDPIEGGPPVEVSHPATLVPMKYDQREIDGTVILTGDMQIYISSVGLAIEPQPNDLVQANGKTFRIIAGDPNNYDGITNVVFIVQGRIAA